MLNYQRVNPAPAGTQTGKGLHSELWNITIKFMGKHTKNDGTSPCIIGYR